jgi:hypothetical protein
MKIGRGAVVALLTLAPPPVGAQAQPVPANQPTSSPLPCRDETSPTGEVVVCGNRPTSQGQRLPQQDRGFDPGGAVMSVPLERFNLLDVGATGIHSCSTVGPGGWTGCDLHRWAQQREQWAGRRPADARGGVSVRVGSRQPQ